MSCENCEESAYVIDKLAKLLAEIAVIVNGPEPPLTSWSYHDLPEKVRALKAPPAAVPYRGRVASALKRAYMPRFALEELDLSRWDSWEALADAAIAAALAAKEGE